jgi:hypothetical protein
MNELHVYMLLYHSFRPYTVRSLWIHRVPYPKPKKNDAHLYFNPPHSSHVCTSTAHNNDIEELLVYFHQRTVRTFLLRITLIAFEIALHIQQKRPGHSCLVGCVLIKPIALACAATIDGVSLFFSRELNNPVAQDRSF